MKYFLIALILSLFALSPLLGTSTAFAGGNTSTALPTNLSGPFPSNAANKSVYQSTPTGLQSPLKATSIQDLLTAILGFVVRIGTIIIVFMLIYTGFKFVTSQGEPTEIQKARAMLMWTIIGALIILGAQAISLGIAATVTSISAGT